MDENKALLKPFEVINHDTGEIVRILDLDVPIEDKVDDIGYLKQRIEAEIQINKDRKKNLTEKGRRLEHILDILKATIVQHLQGNKQKVRGVETTIYLTERKGYKPNQEVPEEYLDYTIEIPNLTFANKEIIELLLNAEDIKYKLSSKVDVDKLPNDMKEEYTNVYPTIRQSGINLNDE